MRLSTLIVASAVIILVGAGCSKKQTSSDQIQKPSDSAGTVERKSVTFENPDASLVYTMDEVSAHATSTDCWFVIGENVYDVSNAGTKHPGGDALYEGCGEDATTLFETRPMGSGTPHSEKAREYLKNYEIGVLAK